MKTKILIVEPAEVVAAGIAVVLQEPTRFNVLDPIDNIDDADIQIGISKPDVVIVNPTMQGAHTLVEGHAQAEGCVFIALCYQYVPQLSLRCYDAVIDVTDSRATVVEKVLGATSKSASKSATDRVDEGYELTKRETAVLVLVAKGLMNKEIADKLNVSVHTVITHRKNIMHKTGIKSVAGLTIYAMLHNLIDDVMPVE